MSVSLQKIAQEAGVSRAAVCMALRDNPTISASRRKEIREIARRLGYQPNAAGRALITHRMGQIGFILSDTIADGWSNAMFSQALAGVEAACHARGYGLTISRYNLSNVDSFIFPPKVSQRSVDGLVLTGFVEAAIIHRFHEFGIPCVSVGDNVEVAGLIPTIACDIVDGLFQAVAAAVRLGHRHVLYSHDVTPRGREVGRLFCERVRNSPETSGCRVDLYEVADGKGNYADAQPLIQHWQGQDSRRRQTLIIASDQTIIGMVSECITRGIACPEQVSLISVGDSRMCEVAWPPLTAIRNDLAHYGHLAVNLLIDHLDDKKPLSLEMSRIEPCTLTIRKSLGSVSLRK
jgi:LacI family transcriptional regulator